MGDTSQQLEQSEQAIETLRRELDIVVQELATKLSADAVTLFLYDEVTDEFDLPIGHGLYDPTTSTDPRLRPRTYGGAGRIVQEKQPLFAEHVLMHPDWDGPFARLEKIISSAGYPLIHSERVLGILFVNYRHTHVFTAVDKQIIMASALRAAISIAQADVFTALRERRFRSPRSTLDIIARLTRDVMRKPIAIWLRDHRQHNVYLAAMNGLTHSYVTEVAVREDDGSVTSQVIQTGEPQFIYDLHSDSRFHYPNHARQAGWASMLGFPIKFGEQTRGVIEVFAFEPHHFNQTELETLRRLADMAGITIGNTYRSRMAEKLADVTQMLSATPDFDRARQVIVESAYDLTGADRSDIVLLNKQTNSFIMGHSIPPRQPSPENSPRQQGGLKRHIIERGEPIKIDDTTRDPRVREAMVREGIRSLIGVRVQIEDETIGVLYVYGLRANQFTEYDVRVLQTLADHSKMTPYEPKASN